MFSVSHQQPYLSDVCSCKEFFKFRATADSHCYHACVKRGIGRKHTTFTSCQNNCFLCRVDYALEENVLTGKCEFWPLIKYILRGRDTLW